MGATAFVHRTVITASAVCLSLLVTGCAADEPAAERPGDGAGPRPAGQPDRSGESGSSAQPAGPAGKALTAAELDKRVLAQGDVPKYQIKKTEPGDTVGAAQTGADRAECRVLNEAAALISVGRPAASTTVAASSEPADMKNLMGMSSTGITLGSYEGAGAAEAIASLRAAGEACKGGFTTTTKGERTKVLGLTPVPVSGGDEAVAWTASADQGGRTVRTKLLAVRVGGTLVTMHSFSFTGKAAELPSVLLAAQLKKLGGAVAPSGQ